MDNEFLVQAIEFLIVPLQIFFKSRKINYVCVCVCVCVFDKLWSDLRVEMSVRTR